MVLKALLLAMALCNVSKRRMLQMLACTTVLLASTTVVLVVTMLMIWALDVVLCAMPQTSPTDSLDGVLDSVVALCKILRSGSEESFGTRTLGLFIVLFALAL